MSNFCQSEKAMCYVWCSIYAIMHLLFLCCVHECITLFLMLLSVEQLHVDMGNDPLYKNKYNFIILIFLLILQFMHLLKKNSKL